MSSSRLHALRLFLACLALLALSVVNCSARQLRATAVASGFDRPVGVVPDPTDPTVLFVVEQAGRIRTVRGGTVQPTDFLDLRASVLAGGERGLLGLAFAPDHATSGRLFVCFTNTNGDSVVARFRRSAGNPLRVDPATRFDLRWPGGARVIEQPFANHNGGHLAFGPDGYLYLGFGDGGSGNDPAHRAQTPGTLLGKMLRLDVRVGDDDPEGYDVPPSNPFVGRAGVLGEIWALGLRNPWRWSFDPPALGGTGALVIADVGQNAWEEIDYQPALSGGRNYGWRNREGRHDNVTALPPFSQPLRDPIFEYSHDDGHSITGGYVYRGRALGAGFVGRYIFGDFVSSRIWSIALTIDPSTGEATAGDLREHTAELGPGATSPSSFGVDADGELLIVSYAGTIYRITPVPGTTPAPPPPPPPSTGNTRHRTGPSRGTAQAR